eukprot:TRINITY_DN65090_c0_g1_i1.p1 TRINITY_DN65090_c0_g1~~TRINITY_DN65090_c0_g1_i1.p1  ORF type:complete len:155 (+),score=46.11 TRINITY_DN65090_c0_g1_i1:84-548(+)
MGSAASADWGPRKVVKLSKEEMEDIEEEESAHKERTEREAHDEFMMEAQVFHEMKGHQVNPSMAAALEKHRKEQEAKMPFTDVIRFGYIKNQKERQKWHKDIRDEAHRREEEDPEATIVIAPSTNRPGKVTDGLAVSQRYRAGWPAGGMHTHGW